MAKDIYEDIAKRTGGDIYIGVVGPVRTGRWTMSMLKSVQSMNCRNLLPEKPL